MAESESGLKKIIVALHSGLVIAWVGFSTGFFGIVVIIASLISHHLAYRVGKFWGGSLLASGRIRVHVEGLEKLNNDQQYIFIANHASVFDIPALYVALPFPIGFLAKKELYSIPFFGKILESSGNICIDRSSARKAKESMLKAIETIKRQKTSLVLFPEGTRTEDGLLQPFKSASFALVGEAGINPVPILISGSYEALKRNSLMVRSGTIHCKVADPIPFSELDGLNRNQISQKIRDVIAGMQG